MRTVLAIVSELLAHGTPREEHEVLKRCSLVLAIVPSLLIEDHIKGDGCLAGLTVTDDERQHCRCVTHVLAGRAAGLERTLQEAHTKRAREGCAAAQDT